MFESQHMMTQMCPTRWGNIGYYMTYLSNKCSTIFVDFVVKWHLYLETFWGIGWPYGMGWDECWNYGCMKNRISRWHEYEFHPFLASSSANKTKSGYLKIGEENGHCYFAMIDRLHSLFVFRADEWSLYRNSVYVLWNWLTTHHGTEHHHHPTSHLCDVFDDNVKPRTNKPLWKNKKHPKLVPISHTITV